MTIVMPCKIGMVEELILLTVSLLLLKSRVGRFRSRVSRCRVGRWLSDCREGIFHSILYNFVRTTFETNSGTFYDFFYVHPDAHIR